MIENIVTAMTTGNILILMENYNIPYTDEFAEELQHMIELCVTTLTKARAAK